MIGRSDFGDPEIEAFTVRFRFGGYFLEARDLVAFFLKGISWWEKGGSKGNKSRFYPLFIRYLPNNFTTHETMLEKDSLDFTFSLPHSGHFAFFLS
jgi:hypothetical protein